MQHVPSASGTMCEGGSVPPGLVTLLREHILTGPEAMHPTQRKRESERDRKADLQDSSSPKGRDSSGSGLLFLSYLWPALLCSSLPCYLSHMQCCLLFDGCGFPHWHWWWREPLQPLPAKTKWLIKEIWATDYVQKDLLIMFRNNLKFQTLLLKQCLYF